MILYPYFLSVVAMQDVDPGPQLLHVHLHQLWHVVLGFLCRATVLPDDASGFLASTRHLFRLHDYAIM